MSRDLPQNPNLDHLRKQAKELLRELRQTSPWAKLSDAQHEIACLYGFGSWPKLKTFVESESGRRSPLAGRWRANSGKSTANPDQQWETAVLEIQVAGPTVTISDMVRSNGREEPGRNVLVADGSERSAEYGYAQIAHWMGPDNLEVTLKKDGRQVSQLAYRASADGMTLTLSASSEPHDGYPAVEQRVVFDRVNDPEPEVEVRRS